jgi:hypothetical protein
MGNRFTELTRAERLEFQILGKLTLEKNAAPGESFLCNTLNISTSGALVETGSMIPIGSLLKYSVNFPGFDRTFDIMGEVVRGERKVQNAKKDRPSSQNGVEAEPRKLIRYGIMFLDLKEEDRSAIEVFFSQARTGNSGGSGPAL